MIPLEHKSTMPTPSDAPVVLAPAPTWRQRLQAELANNLQAGRPPFAGCAITTLEALRWIVDDRDWSGLPNPRGRARIDLREALLQGAEWGGVDLFEANLQGAHCAGIHLARGSLRWANLRDCQFTDGDLREVAFFGANLRAGDLRRAILVGADFGGTDLRGADFTGADLREASFVRTDLRGTIFTGTILEGVDPANLQGGFHA